MRSIRDALPVLGTAIVVAVLIGILRAGTLDNAISAVPTITAVALGMVGVLYLIVRYYSVRVFSEGIEGKSIWGFTFRFFWRDIEDVRFDKSNGIPAAVLVERLSGCEMWIPREIFSRSEFQRLTQDHIPSFAENQ